MTVDAKVKQTLASLKGAQASIKIYRLHHPDADTKLKFSNCENSLHEIIKGLETRIQNMEFEEPQFRGK